LVLPTSMHSSMLPPVNNKESYHKDTKTQS